MGQSRFRRVLRRRNGGGQQGFRVLGTTQESHRVGRRRRIKHGLFLHIIRAKNIKQLKQKERQHPFPDVQYPTHVREQVDSARTRSHLHRVKSKEIHRNANDRDVILLAKDADVVDGKQDHQHGDRNQGAEPFRVPGAQRQDADKKVQWHDVPEVTPQRVPRQKEDVIEEQPITPVEQQPRYVAFFRREIDAPNIDTKKSRVDAGDHRPGYCHDHEVHHHGGGSRKIRHRRGYEQRHDHRQDLKRFFQKQLHDVMQVVVVVFHVVI